MLKMGILTRHANIRVTSQMGVSPSPGFKLLLVSISVDFRSASIPATRYNLGYIRMHFRDISEHLVVYPNC